LTAAFNGALNAHNSIVRTAPLVYGAAPFVTIYEVFGDQKGRNRCLSMGVLLEEKLSSHGYIRSRSPVLEWSTKNDRQPVTSFVIISSKNKRWKKSARSARPSPFDQAMSSPPS
jgi:hypothetical protein